MIDGLARAISSDGLTGDVRRTGRDGDKCGVRYPFAALPGRLRAGDRLTARTRTELTGTAAPIDVTVGPNDLRTVTTSAGCTVT